MKCKRRTKRKPKYDIGKPINMGYQAAYNNVPVGFSNQSSTNLYNGVSGQRQQNIANALNGALNLGQQGSELLSINNLLNAGKISNFMGAAGAGIGAVTNGIKLYGNVLDKRSFDGYGGSELNAMAAKNTEYANGQAYDTIGGVDYDNIMKAADLRDTGENINLTTSAIGTGAGIGGALGSAVPGIGTLAGMGIGAVIGGLGSLIGWNHKEKHEQQKRLNNFRIASNAYNMQNESSAASQGLRNEFYRAHGADKGKSKGGSIGSLKEGEYGPVWTPNGVSYGPVNSYAGKGETIADLDKGEASLITEGTKRVDNIPTPAQDGDNIVIYGNLINPITGISFADQVAPLTAELEALNKIKNNKGDKQTQQVQEREINKAKQPILEQMDNIAMIQEIVQGYACGKSKGYKCGKSKGYKCGKSKGYDIGKEAYLSVLPGLAEMAVGLNQSYNYKKQTPMAFNPYVPNKNASAALDELASLRYDPYNEIQTLKDQERQAIYNYNQASMSPGQRIAMLSQLNDNKMRNKAAILANAQQINNQYSQSKAQASLQQGEQEAAREQQGNTSHDDMFAKSIASHMKGIETGWQTMLKGLNASVGNYLNNYWTSRMIDLYDKSDKGTKLTPKDYKLLKSKKYNPTVSSQGDPTFDDLAALYPTETSLPKWDITKGAPTLKFGGYPIDFPFSTSKNVRFPSTPILKFR